MAMHGLASMGAGLNSAAARLIQTKELLAVGIPWLVSQNADLPTLATSRCGRITRICIDLPVELS